ncbi:NAD(P)/FAD-dependent oxidoreductase [Halopenitus persicus]|uniref:Sarcosine oxidase subunit beta n=1 Tax=Halopenitus persicus TaxID=1048396 RepID=A0A1H3P086_9EURY|nr:FAD-dependent oxidoreductase [Halopenitus persicus]SDY94517.1 sarcosine oxidase subunit beta [Halopenitus persicus]
MQVIVIGGGIIGVASAYYLRKKGAEVTLLEKRNLGKGSTDRANGGIRAQFSSPVSAKLSKESINVWESFESEFGTDITYRRPGYMFLARTEDTAAQLKESARKQQEVGVNSKILDPSEAKEVCPELRKENYVAATYTPDDGIADPHLGLQGFAEAAREAGVNIRTKVEVTDITTDESGRVTGVETQDESIDADYVVNAAGPWAPQIGRMASLDLPISPKRRQLLVADPETPVPESVPFTIDQNIGVHFRPEREGSVVCGGHFDKSDPSMDPDDFSERISLDWSGQVIEELSRVADYFGPSTEIKRGWAGLYSMTPDHHPIIEETIPGFVVVAGFSGHGFMQSPAAGKLVSEIIVDGSASLVDISMLTADRFEHGTRLEEGTVIN